MDKPKKTISEIEKELKFDKVEPIKLNESTKKELIEEGDYWDDLYKESLVEFYNDESK